MSCSLRDSVKSRGLIFSANQVIEDCDWGSTPSSLCSSSASRSMKVSSASEEKVSPSNDSVEDAFDCHLLNVILTKMKTMIQVNSRNIVQRNCWRDFKSQNMSQNQVRVHSSQNKTRTSSSSQSSSASTSYSIVIPSLSEMKNLGRINHLFLVLICFFAVFFFCEAASLPPNGARDASCLQVQQVFESKRIGPNHYISPTLISGLDLELCPSSTSCCTKPAEGRFKEAARTDLRVMLEATCSHLRSLLTNSVTRFKESLGTAIEGSKRRTLGMFNDMYPKLRVGAKHATEELFGNLIEYIEKGTLIELRQNINTFFDQLFPIVYHHVISPKSKEASALTSTHFECLRNEQEVIRPFGETPFLLGDQLEKSLHGWSHLMATLKTGVQVIDLVQNSPFPENCTQALVKLTYCAHCQGLVSAKPCSGFCLNVARGCLSQIAELDSPWNEWVAFVEKLASFLSMSYNVDHILGAVDSQLSDAVMYATENKREILRKVRFICGHSKVRSSRSTHEAMRSIHLTNETNLLSKGPHELSPSSTLLKSFVSKLSESRGLFTNLADSVCSDDSFVTRGEISCWNGNNVGEYTKTIAGIGVAQQKYNPEMDVSLEKHPSVVTWSHQLSEKSKTMLGLTVASVSESDPFLMDAGSGEGSGDDPVWKYNAVSDDEDYEEGSASSGDFEQGSKPGIHDDNDISFEAPTSNFPEAPDIVTSKKGSAAHSLRCYPSLVLPLLFAALWYQIKSNSQIVLRISSLR